MALPSVYASQHEILAAIRELHCPDGYDVDMTYGHGSFWNGETPPRYRFDIDPQVEGVERADSGVLPLADASVGSVVFDPPFLTYVRAGRDGNGKMALARRFGGYWTYGELSQHYQSSIREAARVLRAQGALVVKCQDIVHNHRLHPTHISVVDWASAAGFRLLDLFVLVKSGRMPSPNRKGTQKHARITHSYFLVFEKVRAPGRGQDTTAPPVRSLAGTTPVLLPADCPSNPSLTRGRTRA